MNRSQLAPRRVRRRRSRRPRAVGSTCPPAVVGLHILAVVCQRGVRTEDKPSHPPSSVLASSAHTSWPTCAEMGTGTLRFAVVGLDRHPDSRSSEEEHSIDGDKVYSKGAREPLCHAPEPPNVSV